MADRQDERRADEIRYATDALISSIDSLEDINNKQASRIDELEEELSELKEKYNDLLR